MGRTPRSASAVAISDCRVIGLDDAQFHAALARNPGFALMLMSIMASRLRDTIASLGAPLRVPSGEKPPRWTSNWSPISPRCSAPRRASATRREGSS